MKWHGDPPNRWTALYRLCVLLLLIWLVLLQGSQQQQLDTVTTAVATQQP